jgi:hypothetical protein
MIQDENLRETCKQLGLCNNLISWRRLPISKHAVFPAMVNLSNLSLQNILRYLYKPYHVICIFNQKNNSKTQQLIVIISDPSCCVIVKGFRPLDTEIVDKKKPR